MNDADITFIRDNMGRHKQLALGTTDESGHPWVVCVNLAYDEKFNIIWQSKKDTEHSKNIARDPHVSICVFSEAEGKGDFGFYAKAIAHEVIDEQELARCLDIRFAQKGRDTPPAADYIDEAPMRIYIAELTEAWVNDDSRQKRAVDLSMR